MSLGMTKPTDSPADSSRSAQRGPTRRSVLSGLVALSATPAAAQPGSSRPEAVPTAALPEARRLSAAPLAAPLRPPPARPVDIWSFDGVSPAPVLTYRHGEPVAIELENRTPAPLSLHWQGLRGPAEMDGVGGFSQPPVAPGKRFTYRFTPPDSGTILYRPLVLGGSAEPSGRGLTGLLVVSEAEPPPVELDLGVVVNDWLLSEDHKLLPFETAGAQGATAGRLGSWITVNGRPPPHRVAARPGSRIRLRLANACNARIMRLRFDGIRVHVVAVDGQPTDTFEPVRAQLPFGPGTRYDLMLNIPDEPDATLSVTALIGAGVPLVRLVAEGARRNGPALPPISLKGNPLLPAAVRLQDARRGEIVIAGGARIAQGRLDLEGVDLARPWTLNGATGRPEGKPLFSVKRGTPVVIALDNRTAFLQPLHVHGHHFRLLHPLDDGWEPYFLDTVQVPEGRRLHIAFVADNPGRWLISSTVAERFDLGLWTWFEVS